MAQPTDAHSSFIYLVDNIPVWKSKVDALSDHAAKKTAEFAAEYGRIVNQTRPPRRKSPSMTSIHTMDDKTAQGSAAGSSAADAGLSSPRRVEINPLEAGNRYLCALARRKRKSGNSIRSSASGPPKSRNKNQAVIHYDGYLQEQLDSLVKSIGLGRNQLRKGKNALAAARGFRLPTLALRCGHDYPSLDDIRSTIMSQRTRTLGKPHGAPGQPAPDSDTAFLQVDKELEVIQSLCETAAHQFLRDGDCEGEFDNIRQKLDAVLAGASTAAESVKKLQQQTQETGTPDGPLDFDNVPSCTDSDTTLSSQSSLDFLQTPKFGASMDPNNTTIQHTLLEMKSRGAYFGAPVISNLQDHADLATDTIEVDDSSDQGSIDVDITHYRLACPRGTRV